MEPRIATLLGGSGTADRNTIDSISLPPLLIAPRRPQFVEPATVSDDVRQSTQFQWEAAVYPAATQGSSSRQKPGGSLAEVLNDEAYEASSHARPQQITSFANNLSEPATAHFSGRLSDILVDPSQHYAKRRKIDEATPAAPSLNDNAKLQLPKPVQISKKSTRRPRIPPLLQGLHQPPPLPPQDRLFPPITGEGSGFGRDRVGLRSPVGHEHHSEKGPPPEGDITVTPPRPVIGKDKETEKLLVQPTSDKENKDKDDSPKNADTMDGRRKEAKKRNKWSEEETKDLLQGVSRFGIGSWKKILNCPDYKFNSRTAVDLKDRFRTCCPGEGLKVRKSTSKANAKDNETDPKGLVSNTSIGPTNKEAGSSQDASPMDKSADKPKFRKTRADKQTKSQAELVQMGIDAPFFKTKRRERRDFTDQDDESLMKGYQKYGFVWHAMRDDTELGFGTRHPTDLRDRFRRRYPDVYEKAGYKLKSKEEKTAKSNDEATAQGPSNAQLPETTTIGPAETPNTTSSRTEATITASSSSSNLKAHAIMQPLSNFYSEPFDDFADLVSEYDGEGGRSPITLSRTILHWADANPSSSNPIASSTSIPSAAAQSNTGDVNLSSNLNLNLNLNPLPSTDGLHIDPRATFHVPPSSTSNNAFFALPSQNTASSASTSTSTNLTLPTTTSAGPSTNTNTNTNIPPTHPPQSTKHNLNALLRTPNLPTIVYPHVPVASARNTMHNLPPPADLLSGVDMDLQTQAQAQGRPSASDHNQMNGQSSLQGQNQTHSFVIDDVGGFGFAIGGPGTGGVGVGMGTGVNTLAPLNINVNMNGNGAVRGGMFVEGRGVGAGASLLGMGGIVSLEEGLERSVLNSSI